MTNPRPKHLAEKLGVSQPHMSQVLNRKVAPSLKLALKIYQETARKFGLIEHLSPEEIEVLLKAHALETPPTSKRA